MKTFPIFLFFLAITGSAFPQISKGHFLLGGNLRFESVKANYYPNSESQSTNFFLSPNVGYFFFNKLAGGLRVDFSSYKSNSSQVESKQTTTGISPFLRYYFLPTASKINAFLDAGYLQTRKKYQFFSDPAYREKWNGYQVFAGPAFFLSDEVALEFTLGLRHTRRSDQFAFMSWEKSTTVSSGLGLQVHFGGRKQPRAGQR